MKIIYLIRHCKATGQEPHAQLTDEGSQQARQLVSFFDDKNIDYIVSSPYDRAVLTLSPLAQKFNLSIHTDERLRERVLSSKNMDDWMDKLRQSFTELDKKLFGGESSREAMSRGIAVIQEIMSRPEKSVAVITHGNLMSLILMHYKGSFGFDEWRGLTNPDVYEFMVKESKENIIVNRIWK